MNKVIEIRKFLKTHLQNELTEFNALATFEEVPKSSAFPFVVYDIPDTSINELSLEVFTLEIDGWSQGKDTANLENIMHTIDVSLHKKTFMIQKLSLTFYRENRLSLTDDDPQIKRRKYIYQVRTYEGG
jgi:hypothetical protein